MRKYHRDDQEFVAFDTGLHSEARQPANTLSVSKTAAASTANAEVLALALANVAAGTPYTQNFNGLSNTAGSTTNDLNNDPQPLPGWFLNEIGGGARDNDQYAVDTGGSNTGDIFSYGSAGSTDRALGSLQSGTVIPSFGAQFTNTTGETITELAIAYTGE